MRKASRGRAPRILWLAIILVLLAMVGLVAFASWPREDTPALVYTPPTVASTTSTSTAAESSTTLRPTSTTEPAPVPALAFDGSQAMSHIKMLAENIGVRKAGTENEHAAAGYVADYLENLGYLSETIEFPLPDGRVSHNVRAVKKGTSTSVILVGGHMDSKAPSPGANDNASGVAVVLELARDLRDADITATVEFVLFGDEEMIDSNPDHHHYGSRQFAATMTDAERAALVGMVSVDMVAYGTDFAVRTMGTGPQQLTDMLLAHSTDHGLPAEYVRDTGTYGWSDHEPFELAGYAVAWLEWRTDPVYHTEADKYEHCDPALVQETGKMLLSFITGLTEADLVLLASARDIE